MDAAIIGFGRFGGLHAQALSQAGVRIMAIVDPLAESRRRAQKTYPDAHVLDSVEALIVSGECDAAIVASSESSHAMIARDLFTAGMHCLVEKPLALTAVEAEELLVLAEENNLIFQAGYILRYEPRHLALHEHIAAGVLGSIQHIRAKRDVSRAWFIDYGHKVNPVFETLVHDIDVALWMTKSRAVAVQGWGTHGLGFAEPDTVTVRMEFLSGADAVLTSSWLVPAGAASNIIDWQLDSPDQRSGGVIDARLEVFGTQGSAHLTTYSNDLVISTDHLTTRPDTTFWPVVYGRVGGALAAEAQDFANRMNGNSGMGVHSITDAIHGQWIAEAAVRSMSTGLREIL
jgi:predicted dehydrogenase